MVIGNWLIVNRLKNFDEEDEDDIDNKYEESNDLSINPNRIRQRKVIPLKSKVDTRIEQLKPSNKIISDNEDDDDDDDDDDDGDDDAFWFFFLPMILS